MIRHTIGYMNDPRKILVIGNKYHGKTTFARFLQQALGDAQSFSTSEYLVYRLSLLNGVSVADIHKEKEKYRPELIKLGNAMCNADAGCLVTICMWSCHKTFAIIDGVRRISEYTRVKDWFEQIIWINRPSEPKGLDNLELDESHANRIILNDGSLEELQAKAIEVAAELTK